MIDYQLYYYPDFRRIMQTYKTKINNSQEKINKKYFGEFYKEQPSKGIVGDSFMTQMIIRQDTNFKGEEVFRPHQAKS